MALVNNDFYYAALPRLYEAAAIKFYDYDSLESAVNEITAMPRWKHYQAYLRRLDVMTLPETWSQVTLFNMNLEPARNPKLKDFINIGDYIPDAADFNLPEKGLTQWRTPGIDLLQLLPSYYKEKDWQPLIKLLATLSRLEVLNYAMANNFPSCLLQALHQYHPTCQLNIWSTQNNDADPQTMLPESWDPFAVDLFRSPCLHAIRVYYYHGNDLSGLTPVPVEQDGLSRLITMAPNLRHLQISSSCGDGSSIAESNRKLESFMTSLGPSQISPPRLTSFTCSKSMTGGESIVTNWGQYFDFSNLRALDVGRISNVSTTVGLFSRLRKLERLLIDLEELLRRPGQPRVYLREADFRSIFGSLSPLKYLRIRGLRLKSALHAVLEYHGKSLRGLSLEPDRRIYTNELHRYHAYPSLVHDDILNLAKKAPYIRDLRLTIERSKGDHNERLLYEALGAFPCLQNLTIDLHCKPRPHEIPPMINERDPSYWATHMAELEEALMNAAIDETLVTEIWSIIYSQQQTKRLRNIHVVSVGWDLFTHTERDILFELSRSFLISQYSLGFEPVIVEIGRGERQLHVEREAMARRLHKPARSPPQHLRELIQSLWGLSEPQMKDWTLHWRSFPLDP